VLQSWVRVRALHCRPAACVEAEPVIRRVEVVVPPPHFLVQMPNGDQAATVHAETHAAVLHSLVSRSGGHDMPSKPTGVTTVR